MSGLHELESSVLKEVASLSMVVVGALLFMAFFTTLRPSVIAAVRGDKVIDVCAAGSKGFSQAGTPR
jgi:hypothetical protein